MKRANGYQEKRFNHYRYGGEHDYHVRWRIMKISQKDTWDYVMCLGNCVYPMDTLSVYTQPTGHYYERETKSNNQISKQW